MSRPLPSNAGAVTVVAACATGASAAAQSATTRRRRVTVAKASGVGGSGRKPERPELVADEVERRDEDDRDRLPDELSGTEQDQHVQGEQVGAERSERHDEETDALRGEPAPAIVEGPDAVQRVVVR